MATQYHRGGPAESPHEAKSNALTERLRKLEALAARPGTPGEGNAARAALERIKARLNPKTVKHRPCTSCGHESFFREAGKGPHAAHLRCAGCGRGGRWLSRREAGHAA